MARATYKNGKQNGTTWKEKPLLSNRADRRLKFWLERVDDRFMGTPVGIHPHDALRQALWIAAGEVAYCDKQISRLYEDELFERPTQIVMVTDEEVIREVRDPEVISRWVQLRDAAADRMAKYAKMMLDNNIEERTVLAEKQKLDMLKAALMTAAVNAGLSDEQKRNLGSSLRTQLLELETVT